MRRALRAAKQGLDFLGHPRVGAVIGTVGGLLGIFTAILGFFAKEPAVIEVEPQVTPLSAEATRNNIDAIFLNGSALKIKVESVRFGLHSANGSMLSSGKLQIVSSEPVFAAKQFAATAHVDFGRDVEIVTYCVQFADAVSGRHYKSTALQSVRFIGDKPFINGTEPRHLVAVEPAKTCN